MFPVRFCGACFHAVIVATVRCLDCSDVNLLHLHHGSERTPGGSEIRIG